MEHCHIIFECYWPRKDEKLNKCKFQKYDEYDPHHPITECCIFANFFHGYGGTNNQNMALCDCEEAQQQALKAAIY